MLYLKQSTSVDVAIGPFLDETDGKTAETALTITQPDIRLKKNGGAWAQKNAAQTLSHEEAGWYEVTLDATDTNTLGHLIVAIHESGALPVWKEFMVLPAMIYDSLVAGTDRLDTNVTHVGDTAQTAGDIPAMVTVVDDFLDTEIAAIKAVTDVLLAKIDTINYNKNTAYSNYMFFMADATDGYTAETGLTPTCTRSIDGAAFAACANSPSEVASGWYKINLAAADMNGDEIVLKFSGTGSRNWEHKIRTVAA